MRNRQEARPDPRGVPLEVFTTLSNARPRLHMNLMIRMIFLLVSLGFIKFASADTNAVNSHTTSWVRLSSDFGSAITLNASGSISIEYCPDNTCQLFTAKKSVTEKELKDFVYLYMYFFSDFNSLKEWRTKANSVETLRGIFNESGNLRCTSKVEVDIARCILKKLSTEKKIQIYDIRYDEGKKHKTLVNIIKSP